MKIKSRFYEKLKCKFARASGTDIVAVHVFLYKKKRDKGSPNQ